MKNKQFSPWVFVTYGCTCACPYCMVPKMKSDAMNMPPETFEKMLHITESIFDTGTYDACHFRLSGGEPLLAFHNYKDLVTKYRKKHPNKMFFGLLTNLTIFDNEIIDWMLENQMGMQVSLDDLVMSKPLNNGRSSSEIILKNIDKAKKAGVKFSINTVFDPQNTRSLGPLTDYVCELDKTYGLPNWGLNGSYTLADDTHMADMIELFKDCVLRLWSNGFDIYNKLRFYNSIINKKSGTCTAGINSFSIGTNLELSACQSLCAEKPLGYFSEDWPVALATCPENDFYYNRTLDKDCVFCPILEYCRGGCQVANRNAKVKSITCRIRQEITQFILQRIPRQNNKGPAMMSNNSNCIRSTQGSTKPEGSIGHILQEYIDQGGHEEIETPPLD